MTDEKILIISDLAVRAIRDDADLYASVCKMLDVRPTYLATLLQKKDAQLTQISVLELIARKAKLEMKSLIS